MYRNVASFKGRRSVVIIVTTVTIFARVLMAPQDPE